MERQRERETELRAGKTTAAVQTEMSDESEAFWEDALLIMAPQSAVEAENLQ